MLNDVFEDLQDNVVHTEKVVKCTGCGNPHDVDSDDFVTIYGNVCVGFEGGIIGNSFNDDGKLEMIHIFCHKCLIELLTQTWSEVEKNHKTRKGGE